MADIGHKISLFPKRKYIFTPGLKILTLFLPENLVSILSLFADPRQNTTRLRTLPKRARNPLYFSLRLIISNEPYAYATGLLRQQPTGSFLENELKFPYKDAGPGT
ncbi:hypothetical protein [Chitinophaga sp. YIM B06452]|uniref:hypothetical protein n=1 Tax=Chitinophaga sp. YIM B06452 TaxID=3082158 RepID=UPI0031FE9130